ncbi:MAG: hypothetical protein ACM3X7_15200 [Solirubrobacterales bacterium]
MKVKGGDIIKNKFILIFFIIILSISFTACKSTSSNVSEPAKDVVSIEIIHGGNSKVIFTKEKNIKEINEFMTAYNDAIQADNDLGTTHNSEVVINYEGGKRVSVFGGTQGFQTVVTMYGKQYNIKGDKLWSYFKKLNK